MKTVCPWGNVFVDVFLPLEVSKHLEYVHPY
jgi:hypothetical protein